MVALDSQVLTFTDGSYEVMSAKLVLPSTVSVWGTAAVGIPAFNVKSKCRTAGA